MALPATFLEELRIRTPMQPLVARRVKLARSGRQWKGCCPFHDEKTPSFYVYDDGFHCFGCGAHGDAIGFVMRSEGASFPEAVARLAGEAGLDVPRPTPEAAAAERRRLDLHGVMEVAAALFARRLHATSGKPALDYLRARGVAEASIAAFGLGWSGDGRGDLAAEVGAGADVLAEAGLLAGDDAGCSRPFFFNRVMFPIRDGQGRVLGFGGRVLGDGQPKYLNGPETALFAKRRTLYGLDTARAAARSGADVLVVEGYLDVVALHQAGFAGAVAPLGTALTTDQLAALWKLSPAPILCFDGDAAGARAAARVAKLALPLLEPDRTLRFARLDNGHDPDSLLRLGDGAARMAALVGGAMPFDEALFGLLRDECGQATPEQRASLRDRLEAAAREVAHRALAGELRGALMERFFQARRRPGKINPPGRAAPRPVPSETDADRQRCDILLCLLLNHPTVLLDQTDALQSLPLAPLRHRLREVMVVWAHGSQNLDSVDLIDHVQRSSAAADAESLTSDVNAILPPEARLGAMPAEAQVTFWHYLGLLRPALFAKEIEEAKRAFAERCDPSTQRRLIALRTAQQRASAEPEIGASAG